MKHYCNPMNLEYRYQFFRRPNQSGKNDLYKVYREAADPTLIAFKGLYYLFPSMTAGFFTSEDLHDWNYYRLGNEIPVYDYAPDVRVMGDYMYFSASRNGENGSFYRTKDPRTEAFERIPATFPFWDPNLFIDDDGRVYFYWGCSNMEPIYGVELDSKTMQPVTEKQVMIRSHEDVRGYERFGEEHVAPHTDADIEEQVENMISMMKDQAKEEGAELPLPEEQVKAQLRGYFSNRPYIEGAWMTKHEGRYYLQYAIPGTEYNVYGDGTYIGDSPLGPFKPANNNPYSYKPGGFITGAGHGSTLEDRKGKYWHISSMRISHNENFERRLGLWKAGFDEDGELFCDQRFGDWPIAMDAPAFAKPDWMLLSYGKKVRVSSGDGAQNVTDENIQTIWKAAAAAPGEWAEIDLGEVYDVSAVQINFADDGILRELPKGQEPKVLPYEERWLDLEKQVTCWVMEGSTNGSDYEVLEDKSQARSDLPHDFLEWDIPKRVRFIKVTVMKVPYGANPCISGIRIFGKGNGTMPAMAREVSFVPESEMDLKVTWEAEEGVHANLLWGYAPDKMYHSRTIMGATEGRIGALVAGQPVYIRVDTFNENGITEGKIIKVRG